MECRECSAELVLGKNWVKARARTYSYICRPCTVRTTRSNRRASLTRPAINTEYVASALPPDILALLEQPDEKQPIHLALEALQAYDTKSQYVYLQGIAVKLADALADGKLSWFEIVSMVEYTYQQNFKKG